MNQGVILEKKLHRDMMNISNSKNIGSMVHAVGSLKDF
jgi:hypothetical protein